ncbi:hypothetical protein FF36_05346 [Frankia torreyi]|uniref:Uncharacterized protein n=1 Tax=Frankia torreyi TaxID=1856 RepID=A0A0D8BAH9_9ACTN|nr:MULTISPECIES: hypothetical protein [Frankia]KJE20372.1 hypothetical protein FF36_05346 [Frankia torreyi]KQM02724.1 hypothetical protein FF86_105716 [Frankia sp. CpI1-P]
MKIPSTPPVAPPDRADGRPRAVVVPLDVLRRLPAARRTVRATAPRSWARWELETLALTSAGLDPGDAARIALQAAA